MKFTRFRKHFSQNVTTLFLFRDEKKETSGLKIKKQKINFWESGVCVLWAGLGARGCSHWFTL